MFWGTNEPTSLEPTTTRRGVRAHGFAVVELSVNAKKLLPDLVCEGQQLRRNNYYYLFKALSRKGSPSGLFTSSNLTQVEYVTIQNMHIMYEHKTSQLNPKVSPFGVALVKKKKKKSK